MGNGAIRNSGGLGHLCEEWGKVGDEMKRPDKGHLHWAFVCVLPGAPCQSEVEAWRSSAMASVRPLGQAFQSASVKSTGSLTHRRQALPETSTSRPSRRMRSGGVERRANGGRTLLPCSGHCRGPYRRPEPAMSGPWLRMRAALFARGGGYRAPGPRSRAGPALCRGAQYRLCPLRQQEMVVGEGAVGPDLSNCRLRCRSCA